MTTIEIQSPHLNGDPNRLLRDIALLNLRCHCLSGPDPSTVRFVVDDEDAVIIERVLKSYYVEYKVARSNP